MIASNNHLSLNINDVTPVDMLKRIFSKSITMLFLGAGIVSCSQPKIELQQPNIIYMFADDAGYADFAKRFTPILDAFKAR